MECNEGGAEGATQLFHPTMEVQVQKGGAGSIW